MKKWIAMLMTFMMVMVCVCPAGLAADPTDITVTVTDQDGNTYTKTLAGVTDFDSETIADSLGLSTTETEKVKAATQQAFSASVPEGQTGPIVLAGTNAEGKPVTIEISSDISMLQTEDNPVVVVEGDIQQKDTDPAILVEGGAPRITVNGQVSSEGGAPAAIRTENETVGGVEVNNEAVITVGGDVTSDTTGVFVEGNAEVTVGGSVDAGQPKMISTTDEKGNPITIQVGVGEGIVKQDSADATVHGDVTAWGDALVLRGDGTVTVDGNVTSKAGDGIDSFAASPAGYEENQVVTEVKGDVIAKYDAVNVYGQSDVTIHGSVTSEERQGVIAYDATPGGEKHENQSHVLVEKDVTAAGNGVAAQGEAVIEVKGNVDAVKDGPSDSFFTAGVFATENAKVKVGGNVTSQSVGAQAGGDGEIHIDGNLDAKGKGAVSAESGTVEIKGNLESGSIGAQVYGDGTITIGGDLESKKTGAELNGDGKIIVTGNVEAQGTGALNLGGGTIDVSGNVTSQNTGVANSGEGKITVGGNVEAQGAGVANAGPYHGTTEITGNVKARGNGVSSLGDGTIKIGGNVESQHIGVSSLEDGTIKIDGNVDAQNTGIVQNAGGEIYVGGNVTSQNTGVESHTSGSVEVHGDITAGHVETITFPSGYSYDDPVGMGVSASGSAEVTVDGNVQAERTGIVTMEGAGVTVHGDVTGKNANGVSADGQSIVTVDGNVTGDWSAVNANMDAEVTIRGDANGTVNASDQSHVTVEKNVTDKAAGVYASHDAEVNILGSVNVDGRDMTEAEAVGISATAGIADFDPETWTPIPYDGNPTVTVGGDVTVQDGIGIQMDGRARVTVQGDVTAATAEDKEEEVAAPESNSYKAYQEAHEAAYADVEETEQTMGAVMIDLDENHDGQLIVGGTVRAGDQSVPIVISYHVDEDYSKATEMPELPEMKIYEIAPNNGEYFDVNVMLDREVSGTYVIEGTTEEQNFKFTETNVCVAVSEEDRAALVEAVAAAIEYIIRVDPEMKSSIQIADDFYDSENDLYAAHENEDVSVTLKLDGYDLTATGNYTLLDNGDGTWTLTVQRGGGVTLSAVIKKSGSPAAAGGPSAADAEADAGWRDSRVGKKVLFGRYDLDGNGEKEDLEWIVLRVADGSARLATARGMEAIPADFDTAFNEEEAGQIRTEITPLDRVMSKSFFGDGMVHASMYVNLAALHLD